MVFKERSYNIHIVGDWIYYTTSKESYSIVKIRTDGTERTILADDNAEYMNVVGDIIFYANFSSYAKLYTMRVDGTDRGKVYQEKLNDKWPYLVAELKATVDKLNASTGSAGALKNA